MNDLLLTLFLMAGAVVLNWDFFFSSKKEIK